MSLEPTQEPLALKELVGRKLEIPGYQRPYKWSLDHVTQLLEDIYDAAFLQNKIYRIGHVIIHEDENDKKETANNIVDGQQRLMTLALLLHELGETDTNLSRLNYRHTISQDNILTNLGVIKGWIESNLKEDAREKFKNCILEKCQFVLFIVHSQEEAFQLFDLQNSRGRSLEPYDLLKAFHLRQMEQETEEAKELCATRWEKSIDEDKLKPIFNDHLFRIRKWSKGEKKYYFTKDEIGEFKGVSLHEKQQYPYETALRLLDGLIENAQHDKMLINSGLAQTYPFSVTMPIINGKRFFEYVDYYVGLKERMFAEGSSDLQNFREKYCLYKWGSGRSGDTKVRNLYENVLLQILILFLQFTVATAQNVSSKLCLLGINISFLSF